jgi:hypothetical protein
VLYVNDGDGTFTDRTAEYGLEHVGYATQAAFLDYDRDGDLDVYLLSHSTHTERAIGQRAPALGSAALPIARNPRSDDRLLRNDRGPDGRPRFVDASAGAGLVPNDGFGLGVVASDVNMDGCPDLYVANDFQEDDLLYLNRCDGTFAESLGRAAGHTSRFSMGVDAADVNDDGRPDLFVGDMLPEREEVLKTSASAESFNLFNLRLRAGYRPQYARNTLQLNRGPVGASGDTAAGGAPGGVPRLADVAYLAGVHASDWSWAPLFADLDLDGRVGPVRDQRDLAAAQRPGLHQLRRQRRGAGSARTRRRRRERSTCSAGCRRSRSRTMPSATRATCASPTWPRRGGSRSPASATARPTSTSTTTALSTSWSTRSTRRRPSTGATRARAPGTATSRCGCVGRGATRRGSGRA